MTRDLLCLKTNKVDLPCLIYGKSKVYARCQTMRMPVVFSDPYHRNSSIFFYILGFLGVILSAR